jgi:hypothetical protein
VKKILISLILVTLYNCQKREKIPPEMNIAFNYIENVWNKESIKKFKNWKEDDTVYVDYHFGIGLNIRNFLLRNGEHSEKMKRFFDSLGVGHYDDMSGIILNSYHKHLNGERIELESQVEKVKEYWEPIFECKKKQELIGLEIYNRYKINDTINLEMPVSANNSVVDYSCPNLDWEFRDGYDLSIDGVIIDKGFSVSETNVYFTVKILNKSIESTQIFMSEKTVGDQFTFMLKETAWKIK